MSTTTQQPTGVLEALRSRLARAIAPATGDNLTERWDTLTVTPITEDNHDAFRVTGTNTASDASDDKFTETVDYITLNGTRIGLHEELQIDGGVEFEYYWSPEIASIDIHQ